jgi:hypothetical protein
MGTWNYRVFKDARGGFAIHEAYYACTGKHGGEPCKENHEPHSWSQDPATVGGEDLEGLAFQVEGMKLALERPVLHLARLEKRAAMKRAATKRKKKATK